MDIRLAHPYKTVQDCDAMLQKPPQHSSRTGLVAQRLSLGI